MKPTSESSTQEVLAGLVERVTFHNEENGFCVLRAKARGHRDLVTVVGHAAIISAGEWITASGEWINDRAHGQQFKARFLKSSAPSSIEGIEKYLGSGMIRGTANVYGPRLPYGPVSLNACRAGGSSASPTVGRSRRQTYGRKRSLRLTPKTAGELPGILLPSERCSLSSP